MHTKKSMKALIWLRQISSFTASRIILTANKCRLFDNLEGTGRTSASLSRKLKTDKRATELLLNSLVAIGLLRKHKNSYRNRPVASRYLIRGKPGYQGDILMHYSILWDNWSGLDDVLKTGKPHRKSHDHKSFILGMHNLASLKAGKVLGSIDWRNVKNVLDLGGGPGTYSMAFAQKNMNVTLMDFPDTLKIARKLIRDSGMQEKIRLLPGDFMKDDIGNGYEMVFISHIFHAYSPEECSALLRKSFKSLHSGGKVVIQEFYLDETRTSPPVGAVFAINMLVNTPAGRTYTPREMSAWIKKAGFANITKKISDDAVLISATKK